MPKIEIISIRLNLDKNDDRRLFEKLQKRLSGSDRSRNELLKELLLESLSGKGVRGKKQARPAVTEIRKQPTVMTVADSETVPEKAVTEDDRGSGLDAESLVASLIT